MCMVHVFVGEVKLMGAGLRLVQPNNGGPGPGQQYIYIYIYMFKILWFSRILFYAILYNIGLYFMS